MTDALTLAALAIAALVASGAIALAAFAGVLVSRLLPGISSLTLRGLKPFACDPCYSAWWSAFWAGLVAVIARRRALALLAFPATGWTILLVRSSKRLSPGPPA